MLQTLLGRRIYTNLKNAIRFVISIHIPIILIVFIPLILGWKFPNIFSPIHIIFLELIMGPTCSIIYENEPMETNQMEIKPRPFTSTFLSWRELLLSITQGLIIAVGTLIIYQYSVKNNYTQALTRTMVFATLITANIFLTLVNRSSFYSFFTTLRYKNNLLKYIILATIVITAILFYFKPVKNFFEFETLNALQLCIAISIGLISVIWYEFLKWIKRKRATSNIKN